jgi:UDP-glucose 4-epimerase
MTSALPFSQKRVLITGANGFIGARLAQRLAREGAIVHGVVSPESRAENLAGSADAITIERADIRDRQALTTLMKRVAPRLIYHLASYGNHPQHYDSADALVRIAEINVMGTANLLAASLDLDIDCLINTGSAFAEYGAGTEPMQELQRLVPSTYYGAAKAGATLLASAYGATTGRRIITLRPLYVYGPGDWAFRFIPTVIGKCLRGDVLSVTSLQERKNFVFIDDVVDAYRMAALAQSQDAPIINIGSRSESTLADVIRLVERCVGRTVHYVEGSYDQLQWIGDCWAADIRLAERVLGWQPKTSLEEGIRQTVDWIMASKSVDAGPRS